MITLIETGLRHMMMQQRLLMIPVLLLLSPAVAAQPVEEAVPLPISVLTHTWQGQRMGHVLWVEVQQRIREATAFTLTRRGPRLMLRIHVTNDNQERPMAYASVLTFRRADEQEVYLGSWLAACPAGGAAQCSYEVMDEVQKRVAAFQEEMSRREPEGRRLF